jgi:hypothetical protein
VLWPRVVGDSSSAGGSLPDASWGGADAGENHARPRSWWAMAASTRRYLVKGIAITDRVFPLVLLWGNPDLDIQIG